MKRLTPLCAAAAAAFALATPAQAVPVALELYLAADISGSVDGTDFALQRQGFAQAFQSAAVQSAIASVGSVAVKLVDFATGLSVAVDWTLISNAAQANAFAAAVLAAPRGSAGSGDNQSGLIDAALADMNSNAFEGTRRVLDIASEGAQSTGGCSSGLVCVPVQTARDNFLANGGTTINAIWLNDRNFFGLDPEDAVNAYEYGALNVIGGANAFQTFAVDFTAFAEAIERKIEREIIGTVPEPGGLTLVGAALLAAGLARRTARRA
ncbi:MAG: DUF1194 domain-containing protein [Rubrivivax sp.]|nr:DUF1194 domain-containing protein [Rubrivivax sp.]